MITALHVIATVLYRMRYLIFEHLRNLIQTFKIFYWGHDLLPTPITDVIFREAHLPPDRNVCCNEYQCGMRILRGLNVYGYYVN